MQATADAAWKTCLEHMQGRVPEPAWKNWFVPVEPVTLEATDDGPELLLEAPSSYCVKMLQDRYARHLSSILQGEIGDRAHLVYQVRPEEHTESADDAFERNGATDQPATPGRRDGCRESGEAQATTVTRRRPAAKRKRPAPPPQLQRTYTFEHFVEGDCNRMARRAALSIAEGAEDDPFNPFLVYGGVGLGKTHLVQAIGNRVSATARGRRVLYVSGEQFTSQFVRAIQNNRMAEFCAFYRRVDLLIVDDVQFFSGKEKTQEEFFHIFNELHQHGKRIVLCADRPPSKIDGIEERLLSRFQWGLQADVQAPDLETRTAICRRKAEGMGLDLEKGACALIARAVRDNIRRIEGALCRLQAHQMFTGETLTAQAVCSVLGDLISTAARPAGMEEIARMVATFYRMSLERLVSRSRKQEVATARQVAMYMARKHTDRSYKSIGLFFGGRDHSTVIYGVKTVENRADVEPAFQEALRRVEQEVTVGLM